MRSVALKVRRYLQEPGECAVAAAASVANFYNDEVDYDFARKLATPDGEGMYTADIGRLLNQLGFANVTIVTADLDHFDFEWKKLRKAELIRQLKRGTRYCRDASYRQSAEAYIRFLSDDNYDNNVVIDHHFGEHIREHLMSRKPALASFNFTIFHGLPKWNDDGEDDPIKGEESEHEVVLAGCDNDGVEIVDSHHELYHGRLKRFRSGRYRVDWETLHTVMGHGDLILPDGYNQSVLDELVSA
jgi:hypothetical protein